MTDVDASNPSVYDQEKADATVLLLQESDSTKTAKRSTRNKQRRFQGLTRRRMHVHGNGIMDSVARYRLQSRDERLMM